MLCTFARGIELRKSVELVGSPAVRRALGDAVTTPATPIHLARSVVHFLRTVRTTNGHGTSIVALCVPSPAPSATDARKKHPKHHVEE